jgi:hypothetical protein
MEENYLSWQFGICKKEVDVFAFFVFYFGITVGISQEGKAVAKEFSSNNVSLDMER